MDTRRILLAGLLFLLTILALPASFSGVAAASAGGNDFPVQPATLWLSAQQGSVPGAEGQVLLMVPTAPQGSMSANVPFVPVLEPLGVSRHEVAWYGLPAWNATVELAGDSVAQLHFFVGVQGSTRLRVELQAVASDGHRTTLAVGDQTLSVQHVLPFVADVPLVPTGAHAAPGDALRLAVSVEDINVLTWMQYDASTTPSSVSMRVRVTDTDGDGIPDDVDACPLDADCDRDGSNDGDQVAYYNATSGAPITYHQHYYGYGQDGRPGQPGGAGEPGTPGNPFPQPGTGAGAAPGGPDNVELGAGIAMAAGSLLLALGGLFGRHPL